MFKLIVLLQPKSGQCWRIQGGAREIIIDTIPIDKKVYKSYQKQQKSVKKCVYTEAEKGKLVYNLMHFEEGRKCL